MKKFFAVILSLALLLSLVACKKTEESNNNSSIISSDIMVDNNSVESNDNNTNDINSDTNNSSSPSSSTTDSSKTDNGDVLYFENAPANDVLIEFKDVNGNTLIKTEDISKVSAKLIADINQYAIQLDFTKNGTQKIETATKENIGKTISIYIDGQLIVSPVVNDVIKDGKVLISDLSSKEEMLDIYYSLTLENPLKDDDDVLPLPQDVTKFIFSSGAGAWGTVLDLNKEGDFSGNFHDSEMGENTDEYPDGTVYLSVFTGKFTNFEKINDYSYKMIVADVKTRDEVGKEWIEQGIRYVATTPYGIDGGTEFILYLPQTPVSELPEDFLYWWPARFESEEKPTTLSYYGILNVATNDGFFTYEKA